MKKTYLLAAFAAFALTANAQFTDDMESYADGPLFGGNWSTWSGSDSGNENIIVTTDQAASGSKSGFIDNGQGPQDALLLLGNKTSGFWTVSWNMFIPNGASAYINLQGATENGGAGNGGMGVFNSGNIQFDNAGTVTDDNGGASLSYPQGEWFSFVLEVDVDGLTYTMKINGDATAATAFGANSDTTLGGIDFFANETDNAYYIDDINFVSGVLAAEDFNAAVFSVYPNPVVDNLNFKSAEVVDEITVYNILGKVVLRATPNAVSPSIDMSRLSSGSYLVKVSINGTSETIKIIK